MASGSVSTTRSSLGDGGGGDVYDNREAAEAQKWFRAAGPARDGKYRGAPRDDEHFDARGGA